MSTVKIDWRSIASRENCTARRDKALPVSSILQRSFFIFARGKTPARAAARRY